MPQALALAWRRLLRSPGYTLAAVITLALAIGANTAIALPGPEIAIPLTGLQ